MFHQYNNILNYIVLLCLKLFELFFNCFFFVIFSKVYYLFFLYSCSVVLLNIHKYFLSSFVSNISLKRSDLGNGSGIFSISDTFHIHFIYILKIFETFRKKAQWRKLKLSCSEFCCSLVWISVLSMMHN